MILETEKIIRATLESSYLIDVQEHTTNPPRAVAVALHGYGQTPGLMMSPMRRAVGAKIPVVGVRGPFAFFSTPTGEPRAGANVVYNWGVPPHWDQAIRLHHEMLREVLAGVREEFGIGGERILLAGFSQPVGLNYRFAAAYPGEVGGVIGFCGGVPTKWEPANRIAAPVLHIARDADEFYGPEVVERHVARLKEVATELEFHLLPGPHRFPSQSGPLVRAWMERWFGP